jgi:hypothetical protein
MKDFEPRPFQKEMFEKMTKVPKETLLQLPPRRSYYGVDFGDKDGDTTVIAQAKMNGAGITEIIFDEYANLPDYKWYRNPLKWWKWRRFWRLIAKRNGDYPYGRAK